MYNYYKLNSSLCFSKHEFSELELIDETILLNTDKPIYHLKKSSSTRLCYIEHANSHLFENNESVELLFYKCCDDCYPKWLSEKIKNKQVISVNTNLPNWKDCLNGEKEFKKINILAMGDVGSTLAIGLVLLDKNIEIGIYDRNKANLERWEKELNQINSLRDSNKKQRVSMLTEADLFECDVFAFCASKGIPPVGTDVKDVRIAQYEANSAIISEYARKARKAKFKGLFAVVSDPVDQLCMRVFKESNTSSNGILDFKGLTNNQIIGFGLGVMNARSIYYSRHEKELTEYLEDGLIFGPHGKGLVVVNSLSNYNESLSNVLTEKTLNANLEIRELGFKPYIAPSLSSGAYSILASIKGLPFYGSTLMGKAFIGTKLQFIHSIIYHEQYNLDYIVKNKLIDTYNYLRSFK